MLAFIRAAVASCPVAILIWLSCHGSASEGCQGCRRKVGCRKEAARLKGSVRVRSNSFVVHSTYHWSRCRCGYQFSERFKAGAPKLDNGKGKKVFQKLPWRHAHPRAALTALLLFRAFPFRRKLIRWFLRLGMCKSDARPLAHFASEVPA